MIKVFNDLGVVLPVTLGSALSLAGALLVRTLDQRSRDRATRRQVRLMEVTERHRLEAERAARVHAAMKAVVEAAHLVADAIHDPRKSPQLLADAEERFSDARAEVVLEADDWAIIELFELRVLTPFRQLQIGQAQGWEHAMTGREAVRDGVHEVDATARSYMERHRPQLDTDLETPEGASIRRAGLLPS